MPVPAGRISLEGKRLDIDPSSDSKVRELAEVLDSRPALPLRTEAMRDQVLQIQSIEIQRGEPNWGYALSEAIAREGGYTVSFTPNPV